MVSLMDKCCWVLLGFHLCLRTDTHAYVDLLPHALTVAAAARPFAHPHATETMMTAAPPVGAPRTEFGLKLARKAWTWPSTGPALAQHWPRQQCCMAAALCCVTAVLLCVL
jgi:hypothetical protein